MRITKAEQLRVIREGGHVERCHTIPHHGVYSVGIHSYNVANIILVLHPNPSVALVRAALWHDTAERFLGDMPGPAKACSYQLRDEYWKAEAKVNAKLGLDDTFLALTADETNFLRFADKVEFLMWCHDQQAMGNKHVVNAIAQTEDWLYKNVPGMPREISNYLENNTTWNRAKELFA